eukprot:CAMPEP_0194149706 /NCGR_PEP_ID=MMETSP0152-20130528/39461_1 /TAXON_ID=1049557 /ORGANISM="Thalassiothrix antarctica, Strain L6-D1" /LENGTH=321 /DNA_ID=CAMNT_0038852105 /DNA_START=40 /DNA_END=1005 /DNA_ORIENTATION=-
MMNQRRRCHEASDRFKAMLRQEATTAYKCRDYFSQSTQDSSRRTSYSNFHPTCALHEDSGAVSDLPYTEEMNVPLVMSSPNDVRSRMHPEYGSTTTNVIVPKAPSIDTNLIPWRSQMCSWAYTVVGTFGCHRSVVAIAFNLLDRYLGKICSSNYHVTRDDFQLFCMTAFFLAVKVNGRSDQFIYLSSMADMSRGFFSTLDFQETELHMMEVLEWRLSPPTACCFLTEFWKQWKGKPLTFNWVSRSRAILEISVADAFFVQHKSSQLALASILVAGKEIGMLTKELDQFCLDVRNIVDINNENFRAILDHLSKTFLPKKRLL